MKFEHIRQLEERFGKAEEYLDAAVEALRTDMANNPKMTPVEFKHNVAGALAATATVNQLVDLIGVAIFRGVDHDWTEPTEGRMVGNDRFGPYPVTTPDDPPLASEYRSPVERPTNGVITIACSQRDLDLGDDLGSLDNGSLTCTDPRVRADD